MKTLREMMDLIESAQPVDLRARAAELAIQILKNAHMDDDSEQGYIRVDPNALFQFHVLMNTAKKQGVAEADETSWTANSAQFRKEEDLSWTVEVTLEPRADINQGRGRQVKTMTVTAPSRDAAKKKLADYYRKNGWAVTGIKFAGDLDEAEDDKVRRVNNAEYYHLKLLAKEAGITLTGMGADKVTGDLHWQGDTRDGRRVSGTVKKVIDDNGEYIQGVAEDQIEETEVDPVRRIEELFRDK